MFAPSNRIAATARTLTAAEPDGPADEAASSKKAWKRRTE
jgi:hypothetical protein